MTSRQYTDNIKKENIYGFNMGNNIIGVAGNPNAPTTGAWDLRKAFNEAWRMFIARKTDEASEQLNKHLGHLYI